MSVNEDLPEEVKNPFEEVEGEDKQVVPKKRANVISLKPEDLCNNPLGLTCLYQEFINHPVPGERGQLNQKLNLKGKGHELSDFNKIMNVYRKWHA